MEVTVGGFLAQTLNGIVIGMSYALLGLGLAIIVGLLNIPNFVQGGIFALGAYFLLSLYWATHSFWLALLVAPLGVLLLAVAVEVGLLRQLYILGHDYVLLFTFALALVVDQVIIIIWGPTALSILPPAGFVGSLPLGVMNYPRYHLFVMLMGGLCIIVTWLFLERTRYGAIMRAGLEDPDMVAALGINIKRVFTFGYGLGAYLGGLAGALNAPIRGASPVLSIELLPIAFVVIALGGLGNLPGAIVAGIIVGVAQSLVTMFWAEASSIVVFAVMAVILLLRPQGLFGVR
jgi:branched-chain amino acid transport system permease protein